MLKPIISADSHITEPPGTYVDRIDRRFRDRAPRLVRDDKRGDLFVIEGMDKPIPMGLVAAAGKRAEELTKFGARFEDLHRGGWDPEARLADQDRDGVAAEVLYPTVGMMLCNHPDVDFKHACFEAYNLWIAEYCSAHPDRLIGIGRAARPVQQRRHLGWREPRQLRDRARRGRLGEGHRREPHGRVPLLQVRDAGAHRGGRRFRDQHRVDRRTGRQPEPLARLQRQQGRRHRADARDGRRLRPPPRARERDLPGRRGHADDFDPHLDWLRPDFLDDKNAMLLSVHSFVVRTRHHTILVDTCVGNDKQELVFPQWNGRTSGRYLAELAAAGVRPEDIDYVFCTHMHLDHTGWNTRLRDGRWVPTFPAAKYVFNRREWDAWKGHPGAGEQAVVRQNVAPIIESGQVEWVEGAWEIDDQVALWPTPGHTPGHCSVTLRSRGARAVITGDMLIHPVQVAEPDWSQLADEDKALAIRTRSAFVEAHCDQDVLVLGTHFNTPTGVYITKRGGRRRVRHG